MWFQIMGACFGSSRKETSIFGSGLQNLDFSNLGEFFGLFRRAPTKYETKFMNLGALMKRAHSQWSLFANSSQQKKYEVHLVEPTSYGFHGQGPRWVSALLNVRSQELAASQRPVGSILKEGSACCALFITSGGRAPLGRSRHTYRVKSLRSSYTGSYHQTTG